MVNRTESDRMKDLDSHTLGTTGTSQHLEPEKALNKRAFFYTLSSSVLHGIRSSGPWPHDTRRSPEKDTSQSSECRGSRVAAMMIFMCPRQQAIGRRTAVRPPSDLRIKNIAQSSRIAESAHLPDPAPSNQRAIKKTALSEDLRRRSRASSRGPVRRF